jgi:hypothetical protein
MFVPEPTQPKVFNGSQNVELPEATGTQREESFPRPKLNGRPRPFLLKTGKSMWTFRLPRSTLSGEPVMSLKGGVPDAAWPKFMTGTASKNRAMSRELRAEFDMSFSSLSVAIAP